MARVLAIAMSAGAFVPAPLARVVGASSSAARASSTVPRAAFYELSETASDGSAVDFAQRAAASDILLDARLEAVAVLDARRAGKRKEPSCARYDR